MRTIKFSLFFLLTIICIFVVSITPIKAEIFLEKKAVVLIMDYIDTSDLIEANTPNLDMLIENSGTGLMNIRARNRYPSSSYMSLATGVRITAPTYSELSYQANEVVSFLPMIIDSDKSNALAKDLYWSFTGITAPKEGIVNLYAIPIKRHASQSNPNYTPGNLAATSRENGLKISVVGNADTFTDLNRNAVLLAMDENGIVEHGIIDRTLIEIAPHSLSGVRTNHNTLIEAFKQQLNTSDIIIVDFGDTTRIENSRRNASDSMLIKHRIQAIERNDILLGQIINELNLNKTLITIITPNPHREMVSEGNFGLTPFLLYNPNLGSGLVTSDTTRRAGLVSNHNLAPTVINYFINDTRTNSIQIVKTNNSLKGLEDQTRLFIDLRQSRSPINNIFIVICILMILAGYLYHIRDYKYSPWFLELLIGMTMSIPIVFLFLGFTRYTSLPLTILILIIVSLVLAAFFNLLFKDRINRLIFITGLTAILITIDVFLGSPLMLLSPMGSDAIAGGRFYGIGNDYMGILLAVAIIFTVLAVNKLSFAAYQKAVIATLLMMIPAVSIGHPQFGANVGGLVTALITTGILILTILQKRININKLIAIFILTLISVITIARLDSLYSSSPSHAGIAINSLFEGGFIVFMSIIQTKLGILINTISNSNWSLVLLIIILILALSWWQDKNKFLKISLYIPSIKQSLNILLSSAIIVFIVNDTGVIASALIMVYYIAILWFVIFDIENEKKGQKL